MNRDEIKKTISETLAALKAARDGITPDAMSTCDRVITMLQQRPMIRSVVAGQLGLRSIELNNSIDTAHKINVAVKEIVKNKTMDQWIHILEILNNSPTAQTIIDLLV